MGSLARRLPMGATQSDLAQARWIEIREQVQALEADWSQVKVYQDGLPEAGPEIVQKVLAEVQSPNYELLRWLVAQGADLIGTESPALLREEYGYLRAVLTAEDPEAQAEARAAYVGRAASLLAERDAYIARRIAETLPPGGVGLLFIGQAHDVAGHLPTDITVRALGGSGVTRAANKDHSSDPRDRNA